MAMTNNQFNGLIPIVCGVQCCDQDSTPHTKRIKCNSTHKFRPWGTGHTEFLILEIEHLQLRDLCGADIFLGRFDHTYPLTSQENLPINTTIKISISVVCGCL